MLFLNITVAELLNLQLKKRNVCCNCSFTSAFKADFLLLSNTEAGEYFPQ